MSLPLVRDDLLGRVQEVENVFVPMPDGALLAARLFLPRSASSQPVPAILEYIPYRKRDFMRERDEPIHRYFAAHGYASVRVDVRGSGDSDGVLTDEYSDAEIEDGVSLIAWIAQQSWCTGAVGMMGISWGGFNSLQVASRRPPELKAILTLCASDDRYADDAHYMGGCLLNENIQWGSILTAYNALPPDPQVVGERWRRMWLERLDAAVSFVESWTGHPTRDDYWKRGSVCEDFEAITCAVYAVGGWADGYTNAVPRLLAGLSAPRKGLIGPWAHRFPHSGVPGPSIGFLQEALRWWDHWLKDDPTGIMDEPMLRVWMQDHVVPAPQYAERPGRWVAEDAWPSPSLEHRRYYLNPGKLEQDPRPSTSLSITSPQLTGSVSGEWCAFGADGEMPLDQRPDDGRSLTFDSSPLAARMEILGAPVVELEISCNGPVGLIAVRLCDVAPNGASTRVTYGLLNLTHRNGHEQAQAMPPGKPERIRVQLNDIAHAFPQGHQMRLAISTSYWPIAWPAPAETVVTLRSALSTLTLPVRPPKSSDAALPSFGPPEVAPGGKSQPMRPIPFRRTVERDLVTNELVYTLSSDGGEFGNHARAHLTDIDLELGYTITKRHCIQGEDPLSAWTEVSQKISMERTGWSIRIEAKTRLRARAEHFELTSELRAFENDRQIRALDWQRDIPRESLS